MNVSLTGVERPARANAATAAPALTRPLLITMAIACALGIANLNYSQPLLGQMARDLNASDRQIAILPALTQAGFATGVFLLAPLGDIVERRALILAMLGAVTVALIAAALAPGLPFLAAASLAIGITSVISTLVLPFAVSLARPEERGATVGTIAGAMLIGLLLSRTLSGFVGGAFGWRILYAVAAALMIAQGLTLRRLLPHSRPAATMSYGELLASMLTLIRREPLLRDATVNGMLLYGALCAFWASLVFLVESPAYRLGPAAAGLFGLVGAGSALAAPLVGRLADTRSPRQIAGVATATFLAGYVALWLFGLHLWGLIAGVILIDIAAQTATVSNQASVYSLAPDAHSRLYTIYRALYSAGGSAGAYLGVCGWSIAGWNGVCAVGVSLLLLALMAHRRAMLPRTPRGTGRGG